VIDSCRTVAIDTHTKYGTWAAATHRQCRQTATIIQVMVTQTIRISTAASGRFRIPGKSGMNRRFARRLMPNGKAMLAELSLFLAPIVTAMSPCRSASLAPSLQGSWGPCEAACENESDPAPQP
jgi:hypothetical protein